MPSPKGIFGLKQIYEEQLSDNWSVKSDVLLAPSPYELTFPYGYFGGGSTPSAVTTVDRIDYANDTATASPKGPLTSARYFLASTGNSTYGWFGGGFSPSAPTFKSTVDRIDYANDTATASPRGTLSFGRYGSGATGNSSFGYFGGGLAPTGPSNSQISTVDRITYASDAGTTLTRGALSVSRQELAATGNSSYGWFGGGYFTAWRSVIDRIDYSNDTVTASPRGPLSLARSNLAATGNSSYGWFGGGYTSISVSTVDRIDYANDTATASPKGPLSVARNSVAATGNSSFGYFGGGFNPSAPTFKSIVDRIDYANDTATASPKGPLSTVKQNLSATSSLANALPSSPIIFPAPSGNRFKFLGGSVALPQFGYFSLAQVTSNVERIDYTNDTTTSSTRGPLNAIRYTGYATGNRSYGYFGGGAVPGALAPAFRASNIQRIDYSNDTTTATSRGPLDVGRYLMAAVGNNSFGYFGGGDVFGVPAPGNRSIISRIDYANDLVAASPRGLLTVARGVLTAVGNSSYGWFCGGSVPPATTYSTVDRIDYANDTLTASARGPLTQISSSRAATGNSSYGWVFIGTTNGINRIDYANDTTTSSARGTLLFPKFDNVATGNSSYGYICGGELTVSRFDFSNDTTSINTTLSSRFLQRLSAVSPTANALETVSIPKSNTPIQLFSPATSFGYFVKRSLINKIDYTNDTAQSVSRGSISYFSSNASTSNSSYGYISSNLINSKVDRIDYSTDATIVLQRAALTLLRDGHRGIGNNSYGWFCGGRSEDTSLKYSVVDRIDYSNDLTTASPKGPLSAVKYFFSTSGNSSYGWCNGGYTAPPNGTLTSKVDRIDYANDTATTSIRGPLTTNFTAASTGNSSYGYIGGGYNGVATISSIYRIDYSNDTATALSRSRFSVAKNIATATGNSFYGYFGDSIDIPGTYISQTERLDYSNDTATTLVRGTIDSITVTSSTSASAAANGLPQ